MKKLCLLHLWLISAVTFGQIEIFNLDGGGTLPTNWIGTNNVITNVIDQSTYYLIEAGTSSDVIETAVYDLTQTTSVFLKMDIASFGNGSENAVKIEVSYDGGSSYTETKTTLVTTGSTYIDSGEILFNSVSNQVKFKISNNGDTGKGINLQNIVLTANVSFPLIQIDSPEASISFTAGTTNVAIAYSNYNLSLGDYVDYTVSINGGAGITTGVTSSPFNISTSDGNEYNVRVSLKDSGGVELDYKVVDFWILSCPNNGAIIITEIMQNPNAVSDANGEYFEVFNTTSNTIDMNGWVISDNGTDSHVINSTLLVPGNGYAVLGRNGDRDTNGDVMVDYDYNGFVLGNTDDEIILSCLSTEIDRVAFDGGPNFPDPTGASMELAINKRNAADNNVGANWNVAVSDMDNGDFGSPGVVNDFALSIGQNDIEGFTIYPNPINKGIFRVVSANRVRKSIQIFDMLGKQVLYKEVQSNELIYVDNLNSGIYILKVEEEGRLATRKLLVE